MVHIERTPLSDIVRAAVYENSRMLPLSQIVEEEQPDIAMTAVFYNQDTLEPVCPVKSDGKVLYADTQYNYWALSWNTGPDAAPELIMPGGVSAKENYVANCVLVTGGAPQPKLYYGAGVGGRRGRLAVGLTRDNDWLTFGSTDGSPSAMTPEELRDYMVKQDCRFAIMMDGGRKVNLYARKAGVMIEGKDPSQTLILLWLKKEDDILGDVKTYSLKKHGDLYLSKNFRVREFACNDGSDIVLVSDKLVALLQQIRDHFEVPGVVNSGYRTSAYNTKVGGAPRSQHMYGTAADVVFAGVPPLEVAQYAEHLQPESGGIGVYQTFTHVDVRAGRSRWDSRSGTEIVVSGWPGYTEPTEADLAVEWITSAGIMKGNTDGDLMLDDPLTRRQFAVMLHRFMKIQ